MDEIEKERKRLNNRMAGYNILQTINFMSELNLWFIFFSDIFLYILLTFAEDLLLLYLLFENFICFMYFIN